MAVDVSKIPNNSKFDPVREAILKLQKDVQEGVSGVATVNSSDGNIIITNSGNITVGTVNETITIGIDDSTYLTSADISDFITLTDLSVTTSATPSGGGALSYDDTTGVFTFTPADAGTGLTLQQVTANGNTTTYGISTGNISVQPAGTGNGVVAISANSVGDAALTLTPGSTAGNGVIRTTIERGISFKPFNTEKVFIASDGNMNVYEKLAVGKTTAASTYHLEVDGTALANNFITSMTASGTTYTGTVSQYYNALQIRTATGGTISIGGSGPLSVQNNVAIKDGNLDVNGDVTADFFIGDGSQLTNIAGANQDLQDVTDNGATTTNGITVANMLISATAPLLDFVDTNSFTDANDRFRIRAAGDVGQIRWYDDSASTDTVLVTFNPNGNVSILGELSLGGSVINMANDDGLVYNDTNNLMYIKSDGTEYQIIDTRGGTFSGQITTSGGIAMNNTNLTGVNNIVINDAGAGEGIEWAGGNLWKIYESPNDLTNNSGNLQFVTNATRRMTLDTSGNLEVTGTISGDGSGLTKVFNAKAELGSAEDLNDFRTTGYMSQNSNSQAAAGTNYPTAFAGILEVVNDDTGNGLHTVQRYSRYGSNDVYTRYYYNGGWQSWARFLTTSDEGSGNGLDADTVDGLQASQFLRSDTSDTMTGVLTVNSGSGNNPAIFESTDSVSYITIKDNTAETRLVNAGTDFQIETNNGNVAAKFFSNGDLTIYGDNAPKFQLYNEFVTGDWSSITDLGTIEWYTPDTSGNAPYVTGFIRNENETGGTLPSGALSFGVTPYNNLGGAIETFRLKSDRNAYFTNNVGIGTTSPRYQLDLAIPQDSAQVDYIALGVNNGPSGGGGTALGSGIIWKANYSGYTKRSAGIVQIAESNYFQSGLAFYTNGTADTSTDWVERMYLSAGGILQMNRTNGQPTIKGSTTTGAAHLIIDSASGGDAVFLQNYNSGNVYMVTGGGNVGIGITSPQQKLHVVGKIKVSDDIQLAQTNGRIDYDNGVSTGALRFWSTSGNTERMRITSAGNVGIGTNSPSDKLQIDAPNSQLRLRDTDDGTYTQFSSSGNLLAIRQNSTTASHFWMNSSGDVGLGTNSPSYKLEVVGDARVSTNLTVGSAGQTNTYLYLLSSTSGTSNLRMGDTDTDAGAIIYSNASNLMTFRTNAGNRVFIDGAGNVGIGTTAPQAPLHIIAATSANSALIQEWSYTETTTDQYSLMLKQTVTSGVVRYNFSMVNNNTTYNDVLVLDRGKVGFGTTDPSAKIHIVDDTPLKIHTATNAVGAKINFSDHAGGSYAQNGTMEFVHANSASYGQGAAFKFYSTEAMAFHVAGTGLFTGDITAFYSDMRLKTKLGDIENPIEKIQALSGFYYEPNEVAQSYGYEKERRLGLSAQEVKEVFPEAVSDAAIGDGYMSVDYAKLVPVLVEAIKEQQKQIDELKARLDA